MPSIIPGYQYDIFISYRQNDNQDGWVTKFVDSLQKEIKSIFKEDVSIYFDSNPTDGLHETHDVDGSLKEKIKCLVFIPILSRTYCDPRSFAWQKEFLPFLEFVKEDDFGLDVQLTSGNVAKRILPVRIHEISDDDKDLFEREIDGVMRPVDFIYKETGVNRPLEPDDSEDKNLNQTKYRNQVNKVANSIHDIIEGIQSSQNDSNEEIVDPQRKQIEKLRSKGLAHSRRKRIQWIGIPLTLILLALFYFIFQFNDVKENVSGEKSEVQSVAVLAFDDQSPDGDQEWLGDGIAEEIMNVLTRVENLSVAGKMSAFSFKGKNATSQEIAETLGVNYLVQGSVSKIENKIRINASLVDARTNQQVHAFKYDRETSDIFSIVDEVAQTIVSELIREFSPEDLEKIGMKYQPDPKAYESFIRAEYVHNEFYVTPIEELFEEARSLYLQAIEQDNLYMDAFIGLANLHDTRANRARIEIEKRQQSRIKRDSLLNYAYTKDPTSDYVQYMKGYIAIGPDSCYYYMKKAYENNPDHPGVILLLNELRNFGLYELAIDLARDLLSKDPLHNGVRAMLAESLYTIGRVKEAEAEIAKLSEEPNWILYARMEHAVAMRNMEEAEKYILQAKEKLNPPDIDLILAAVREGKVAKAEYPRLQYLLWKIVGDYDKAFESFKQLSKEMDTSRYIRHVGIPYLELKYSPIHEPYRQRPEFQEWLKEGKPIYERVRNKFATLFEERNIPVR